MAECSYARCMQERRIIKKRLQQWTKNCLYTLGFERIAEEFMGRRKWRIYQEQVLKSWFPSIEKEVLIKDWEPNDDKCKFCDLLPPGTKLTEEEQAHNNNNIDPLSLEGEDSNTNSTNSLGEDSSTAVTMMNALDSVTSLAAIAALAGPGGTPLSLYPPGMFQRWYLSPPPPRALLEGMVKPEAPMVMNLPATSGPEMPLDLSAKGANQSPEIPEHLRIPSLVDTKQLFKEDRLEDPNEKVAASLYRAKPRMSPMTGRRSYTEEELQAALRDIQSGKLGTRRAAVIYGIPRSTLRNKVYKLTLERKRDAHIVMSALPRPSPPDPVAAASPTVPVTPDKEDSSATEEERESTTTDQAKSSFSIEDLLRLSALESSSQNDGLNLLLHNITKLQAEGFSLQDIFCGLGLEHSALGPYLAHLLKLREESRNLEAKEEKEKKEEKAGEEEGETNSDKDKTGDVADENDKSRFTSPVVPELMKRMIAEERMSIEEHIKRKLTGEHNGVDDDPSNVILKIPSFKPNVSGSAAKENNDVRYSPAGDSSPSMNGGGNESPPAGKTFGLGISSLRDVIAKSISQKFQQDGLGHVLGHDAIESLTKRNFPHLNLPNPHSVLKNHFDRSQQRIPQPSSNNSQNISSSQGKGTRPKRGKYRNYDRDSLVEAVRAVQRGEMSVHRAGSYYGVPHSTLEYKVKERHLMRPRKREPKEDKNKLTSQINSTTSSTTPTTTTSSTTSGATGGGDKTKVQVPSVPKPSANKSAFPTNTPPTLPNGLKIPPSIFETGVSPLAYSGAPFPFWPPNPFHAMPLDISRGAFPPHPELFTHQMMRAGLEPPPSPSALPPTARRIAESLYDGTGNNGSFLDGIIRSSLETGVPHKQDNKQTSEKTPENMSNKTLLDQLCRNSRLTPVPKPSESNSEDESRNVPYEYSRSSDDEEEKTRKLKRTFNDRDRKSLERDDKKDHNDKRFSRNYDESHSYRSSVSEENDKMFSPTTDDDNKSMMSTDDLQNLDEDIDDISNHASEDDDEEMVNNS